MKALQLKAVAAGLLGFALLPGSAYPKPPEEPPPDGGLLAALDSQSDLLTEGTTLGDFADWYPDMFADYGWTRAVTEVGAGGLFRVDSIVWDGTRKRLVPENELSILLFRPLSPPGSALPGGSYANRERGSDGVNDDKTGKWSTLWALRVMEEALVTAQMYLANTPYYRLVGDNQSITWTARLPGSIAGTGNPAGFAVQRVAVYLRPAKHGRGELILEHAPLLWDQEHPQFEPGRIILAEDVSFFHLRYRQSQTNDWTEQWGFTNSLPRLVQVTLGVGKPDKSSGRPHELSSRMVALPASWGLIFVPTPGRPGQPPTPPLPPIPPRPWPGTVPERQPRVTPPPAPLLPMLPGTRAASALDPETSAAPALLASPATALAMDPAHLSPLAVSANAVAAEPKKVKSKKTKSKRPTSGVADVEWIWMGRSGVELARYILAKSGGNFTNQFDALSQRWAGGPWPTNDTLSGIPMQNVPLGRGQLSIRITDLDRKFNVNFADEVVLRQALSLIGLDAAEFPAIVDSILDWRDSDDTPRQAGKENDYYRSLWPSYRAKNGQIDQLTELLLVYGVTPTMFYGSSGPGAATGSLTGPNPASAPADPSCGPGLDDLFTAHSSGRINVNTASAAVLQLIPFIDENLAAQIISGPAGRAGPDGIDGTLDDTPFRSVGELARVMGMGPVTTQLLNSYVTVSSLVFEVRVDVQIDGASRQFVALLTRFSPSSIRILNFCWD